MQIQKLDDGRIEATPQVCCDECEKPIQRDGVFIYNASKAGLEPCGIIHERCKVNYLKAIDAAEHYRTDSLDSLKHVVRWI